MKARKTASVACSITGTVLLVLVILLCIPAVLPRMMGYEVYTVVSGSMEPEIPVGSLICIEGAEPTEIAEGEVIAFYSSVDAGAVITHRIVENRVISGEFITKGDANEKEDMLPVPYGNVIGRAVFTMPKAGDLLERLTTSAGRTVAVCLIFAGLLLNVLGGYLGKEPAEKKRKTHGG